MSEQPKKPAPTATPRPDPRGSAIAAGAQARDAAISAGVAKRNQALANGVAQRNQALARRAELKVNYRPLGAETKQLADRIHTLQDAGGGAAGDGGGTPYTFTACVSGTPKSFDVLIVKGPY